MRNQFRSNLMMRGAQVCYSPDEESGGTTDNTQGNTGGENKTETTQNNSGNGFDPEKFWAEPDPNEGKSSTDRKPLNAADSNSGGSGDGSDGSKAGEAFIQQLKDIKFDNAFFNDKSLTELSEGKPQSLNAAIETGLRESVRHSVMMAAQLMQSYGQTLLGQMDAKIQESLGNRDSQGVLEKEFPQLANNPGLKPMIQGIFGQSMKHTGNDRTKAVALTKDMLKYMGKNARDDFGIEDAPRGPNEGMTDNSKGLVSFLLDRGP